MILRGSSRRRPLQDKAQSAVNSQRKNQISIRFFFCKIRRKRKSYQKENADIEVSRFAERDHRCRWTTPPFKKKAGENYCVAGENFMVRKKFQRKSRAERHSSPAQSLAHIIIAIAIAEKYRHRFLFAFRFGKNLPAAHHFYSLGAILRKIYLGIFESITDDFALKAFAKKFFLYAVFSVFFLLGKLPCKHFRLPRFIYITVFGEKRHGFICRLRREALAYQLATQIFLRIERKFQQAKPRADSCRAKR